MISWRKRISSNVKLEEIKKKLIPLDSRIEEFTFSTDPKSSYILGDRDIRICIQNSNGNYHDDNFLIYVALHEITHGIISEDTSNHPPIFDETFDRIKRKAIHMGIYDPSIPFPATYCGKPIDSYT